MKAKVVHPSPGLGMTLAAWFSALIFAIWASVHPKSFEAARKDFSNES